MLRLFTEALGAFILQRLTDLPQAPAISYALPGAVPGKDALSLFLCTIAEDADLRSNEKLYEQTAFGWVAVQPPLRLKCSYIVSAWPAADDKEEAALSQARLLGSVYSALLSAGSMPLSFLSAPLNSAGLPKPVIALTENALSNRPEFWISVGCAFRPSFSFTATVSVPAAGDSREYTVEGLDIGYDIRQG